MGKIKNILAEGSVIYVLPVVIFIAIVTMAVMEWRELGRIDREQILRTVLAEGESFKKEVFHLNRANFDKLSGFAIRLGRAEGVPSEGVRDDIKKYISDFPALINIAVIKNTGDLLWSSRKVTDSQPPILSVEEMGGLVSSKPFLYSGEYISQILIPIKSNNSIVGYLVAHGAISKKIDSIASRYSERGYEMEVRSHGIKVCCEEVSSDLASAWGVNVDINVTNGLAVKVWPSRDNLANLRSPLVNTPLVAGPTFATLFALSFYLLVTSFRKSRKIRETNFTLSNLSTAIDQGHSSVLVVDRAGKVLYCNARLLKNLGASQELVIGKNISEIISLANDCTFMNQLVDSINNADYWEGEVCGCEGEGQTTWDYATITPIKDSEGEVTHYLGVRYDITDRKRIEQRLNDMAYYDNLTGAYNRSYLDEHSGTLIKRVERVSRSIAVLFIDLDRFKAVNDTYGHDHGDCLLKEVAERLRRSVRKDDLVVRLGGDEFLVVLTDVRHRDDVYKVAQTIIDAVASPVECKGKSLSVGASIGISVYPEDGKSLDRLIKTADMALYRVKTGGKGHYSFYREDMSTWAEERQILEADLMAGLENNEYEIYFQPQVDGLTNKMLSAETLLRWNNKKHGYVDPDVFIPVLEQSGAIQEVGFWVIKAVAKQLVDWDNRGLEVVPLSVNISSVQLRADDFNDKIAQILGDVGFIKGRHVLEFEITESVLMDSMDEVATKLVDLNEKHGIRVAVDDFGKGYSCLNCLKLLPVDTLKIDRDFVRDAPSNQSDSVIASTIIAMAKSLSLRVVAEGVETEEQLRFLIDNDCVDVQGYYFSKPLPRQEFERLLIASK